MLPLDAIITTIPTPVLQKLHSRLQKNFTHQNISSDGAKFRLLFLECPGAFAEIKETVHEIPSLGGFNRDVLVYPRQSQRNATIVATFSAQELFDVHGSLVLNIE